MAADRPDVLKDVSQAEVIGGPPNGGFQVFGLKWLSGAGHDYATLDEALAEKLIEVTEVNEGGSVPILKVVNRSGRLVFLMAGEELVGCKQNRVLNASMLVPAHATTAIPVTCVERGRWGYKSSSFRSDSTSSHGSLRRMIAKQVSGS